MLVLVIIVVVLGLGVFYGVFVVVVLFIFELFCWVVYLYDSVFGFVLGIVGMYDIDDYL